MDTQVTFQVGAKLDEKSQKEMAKIFAKAFSAPPWCERWTLRKALEEIKGSLETGQTILCFHDRELAGFGIAQPLMNYPGAKDLHALGVHRDAYYIKELATADNFRCKGVCSAIIALFRASAAVHHSQLVLRTRFDNRALFGPVRINGFSEIGQYNAVTGELCSVRKVFAADLRS